MILRPMPPAPRRGCIAAWDAVFATQHPASNDLWLVTQDDHARLAGDLAAAMTAPWLPHLGAAIIEAIRLHDSGWQPLDSALTARAQANRQRPLSFVDMSVPDFLQAWTPSIECVAARSALGGLMVSRHFDRLVEYRLRFIDDAPEHVVQLQSFRQAESARRDRLLTTTGCAPADLETLTDVLQFCDLVSLYLCCGAADDVEFPQRLGGKTIALRLQAGQLRFDPSPLAQTVELSVPAIRSSAGAGAGEAGTVLQFRIA